MVKHSGRLEIHVIRSSAASPLAKALPSHNLTMDIEGHTLIAVPSVHSDINDSSILRVPDLKLAVKGETVCHGASYLVIL